MVKQPEILKQELVAMTDTSEKSHIKGDKIIVYLGKISKTGLEKQVEFKSFCITDSRSLQINKNFLEEEEFGNERDEFKWNTATPTFLSWSMSGDFAVDNDFLVCWQEAFLSLKPQLVKMVIQFPKKQIIYKGWAHIENFEITAEKNSWVKASMNFKGTGKLTHKIVDKEDPNPSEDLENPDDIKDKI